METEMKKSMVRPMITNAHKGWAILLLVFFSVLISLPASAHCDGYDGPVVQDALQALKTNNVSLVFKWVSAKQEPEIRSLFRKTYNLKKGDQEVYSIVEKHFLETLVRLHRQTEGAPYTGLKPAGSTKPIIQLSDQAIDSGNVEALILQLNQHTAQVVREKYQKVAHLKRERDSSPQKGRAYVKAYVDYTHTLEALHDRLEPGRRAGTAHAH